jgi:hypothetical protein
LNKAFSSLSHRSMVRPNSYHGVEDVPPGGDLHKGAPALGGLGGWGLRRGSATRRPGGEDATPLTHTKSAARQLRYVKAAAERSAANRQSMPHWATAVAPAQPRNGEAPTKQQTHSGPSTTSRPGRSLSASCTISQTRGLPSCKRSWNTMFRQTSAAG